MNEEEIKQEYLKVNNPKELLEFMDKYINYGFHGNDEKDYYWNDSDFNEKCNNEWTLCDKERILKYRIGHCFDQTEFEREWFIEHNYKFKTFFIWFFFPGISNNYNTHAYLVYEDNGKYYYFEHADSENIGIYEFNSYEEAILYQKDKLIQANINNGHFINDEVLNHLEVREYNRPKLPCNMDKFFTNICYSKIVHKNNNKKL